MTDSPAPIPSLEGTVLDFTPVPMARQRGGGWSVEMQRRFITALAAMGSVGAACKACGMGPGVGLSIANARGGGEFRCGMGQGD